MGDGLPDPVEPRRTPPLPIAPPVSMHAMAPQIPMRFGWLVLGVAIALVGHVFAGSPILLFSLNGTPDLPFVGIYTVVFQLMFFAGCLGGGGRLMDRNRGLGLGLIIGYVVGFVAVLIGVFLATA